WENAVDADKGEVKEPEFIKNILRPMTAQEGNNLPVSTFNGIEQVPLLQWIIVIETTIILIDMCLIML
ncbi:hypothetical protein ACTPEU_00300, partial [Clostridioides difficile]|uniref:hypothetical protein n=1 Tax=Clostridioides difficile TaxID=1496 RepID=UPI003F8D7D2B